jgi:antitoxin VapB
MALNIKNDEADQLARELAEKTGESITEAVLQALRERLVRVQGRVRDRGLSERVLQIAKRASALPVLDPRRPEDILYDKSGAPK